MKKTDIGHPPTISQNGFERWATRAMRELAESSKLTTDDLWDQFTVSNYTETRTLDASTATTADIANVLCTLIADMKGRSF